MKKQEVASKMGKEEYSPEKSYKSYMGKLKKTDYYKKLKPSEQRRTKAIEKYVRHQE